MEEQDNNKDLSAENRPGEGGAEDKSPIDLPEEPKVVEPEVKPEEPKEEAKEEAVQEQEEEQEKDAAKVGKEAEAKAEESKSEPEPEAEKTTEAEVQESEEPAQEQEKAEAETPKTLGERRWYVIQALTGQEDRVKRAIELTIQSKGLKDKVFQVLVPTEEIVEIKGGKRVEKVKKMFPGYVFLEMILDEESWYLMRETPGVARFIGTKIKPTPVSDREMQRVLKQLGKEERLEITFEKGEGVRVISGPFRGYTGTVDEVNVEKGKLKVLINIFGRDTPVEVNFEHAQKIV